VGRRAEDAEYERVLHFDLSSVVRNMAGPPTRTPPAHQRAAERGIADAKLDEAEKRRADARWRGDHRRHHQLHQHQQPAQRDRRRLLARNANARWACRKPWVKTSLAPGSKAVQLYLEEAGLLPNWRSWASASSFACTTCNGMSGALDPKIQQEIIDRDLYATAVLSGNRNFDGRIHPYAKQAFLASPPLVVAYAIAGTVRFDIENDVLGVGATATRSA
jgi:aconitate hydratase